MDQNHVLEYTCVLSALSLLAALSYSRLFISSYHTLFSLSEKEGANSSILPTGAKT